MAIGRGPGRHSPWIADRAPRRQLITMSLAAAVGLRGSATVRAEVAPCDLATFGGDRR